MKTKKIQLFAFIMTLLGVTSFVSAQKTYTLDAKSTFSVSGTSTIHDWEMKSSSGTGTASFTIVNSKLTDIEAISITLLTESVKSEKKGMDKVAYKTLKTDTQKNIKYVMKSAEKVNDNTWTLTGTYTIAGVAKELKTTVKASYVNGLINLQGTNKITFGQFGMKSPTAMLGAISTGEDLTINFNINFK